MEKDSRCGQSIMVWGAIGINHKAGPVILAQVDVMASLFCFIPIKSFDFTLCPILAVIRITFQQGTARAHTEHLRDFLQQHNIRIMPWPAFRPDLNPIEHMWDEIQRKVYDVRPRSITAADLTVVFFQDMGRDSNDLYEPPYSLHVQEMCVCGQRSWGTCEVLTRNDSTDVCGAVYIYIYIYIYMCVCVCVCVCVCDELSMLNAYTVILRLKVPLCRLWRGTDLDYFLLILVNLHL